MTSSPMHIPNGDALKAAGFGFDMYVAYETFKDWSSAALARPEALVSEQGKGAIVWTSLPGAWGDKGGCSDSVFMWPRCNYEVV